MRSDTEIDLQIDEEFANLLPQQSEEEMAQLEKNIKECGLLSPLVAWVEDNDGKEKWTLIDGHTRYKICQKTDTPYEVVELGFGDRSEVLAWIYENQRGRRNWTAERESYVRGKVYNAKKGSRGGKKPAIEQKAPESTSEKIAKTSGVSAKTVQRDGDFAKAVDRLDIASPGIKSSILEGKATLPKREIQKLANAPAAEVKAAATEIGSGVKKTVAQTDEVLFSKLESAVGIVARLSDELGERHQWSLFYRNKIQELGNEILVTAQEWNLKVEEGGDGTPDESFLSRVPVLTADGFE